MPRPGTDILISEPSPGGGGELDTGQAFMVGVAQRGPVDRPASVGSLSLWERRFGPRSDGPVSHNAVRAFFTERGSNLQFLRLVGATAHAAEAEVGGLQASAASPGAWGNNLQVTVAPEVSPLLARASAPRSRKTTRAGNGNGDGDGDGAPAVPVRLIVTDGGEVVERSRQLRTVGDALAWARDSSAYLTLTAGPDSDENPLTPAAATALTGGVDDNDITAAIVADALGRFGYEMGFAQVLYPGATAYDVHAAILEHCERNRRPALLDLNDTDAPAIAADANALNGIPGSRFAAALAPRIVYPGPAPGTTALVPYSAVQAGIIARADATTGNPNEAAAGSNGESLAARGIARDFDNDTRELLNDLGVTLPRMMRSGVLRTYGTRTVAGPDDTNWLWFPGSRTVLAMAHEFDNAAEEFVHRQIDGQRRLLTRLEVALGGICLDWFNLGALYGDEPEEAFSIDTQSVNTTQTIAAGEVHAIVRLRTSPPGEWIVIEIQKTPITQSV